MTTVFKRSQDIMLFPTVRLTLGLFAAGALANPILPGGKCGPATCAIGEQCCNSSCG
ncbi:hypothetical protein IMZ48_15205 [Candidatus Bathyarchaeota archaeon]|nr:hypothetical protein [Candidatus Bathyarchaeota archaeon]